MEIIGLKIKSKNNPNIFIVKTNDEEFLFHADVIVKNHIKLGEIDDDLFKSSLEESSSLICFEKASKYLTKTIKTEKQVRDYLYKNEFKKPAVNFAIEKLKQYGFLNDDNFAELYVKAHPNFSKEKLKQKLFSFGVKDFDVSSYIDEDIENEVCLNNAKKFLKNKVVDEKTKEKLIRHLMGKGFSWGTIKTTLDKLKTSDFGE